MPQDREHLFLTGATGFFGRSLLRYLSRLEEGHQNPWMVTAMTRSKHAFLNRFPEFLRQDWLRFHEGDILQGPSAFPPNLTPSHILHAAADSTPAADMTPLNRLDQIVNGTRHVLDFAKHSGAKRFLLTSSGDVYGPQPANLDMIPEDFSGSHDPLNPRNHYGCGKQLAEHLCALYAAEFGIEIVVARCFAFVGPDLPLAAHFAIGNFIRDALSGKDIVIKGDGTPLRSYLDQDDLAHWLLALLADGRTGEAYNIGSDEAISIADLARLVRDTLAPKSDVTILQKSADLFDARSRYIPCIRKAKDAGLCVKTPLVQAILKTAKAVSNAGALSA
jgi:dTDP-glucose 4,6-dehydratase